ncbi:hypothetical protein AVEN_174304-1 [Araneus ventricosus]|uniref:Uncharacterized protein n=1 Tax=Araneus ventricosus TaxID=182803 RepID=A0A4Y2NZ87_ARAVE|nr:hypothetical protein AVEN_174304-1 [Araneus ventricosus]
MGCSELDAAVETSKVAKRMTTATRDLAPPLQNSHTTAVGGLSMHDVRCTRPTYTVDREELSFRSGALKPRSRDLTTRPPQPVSVLIKYCNTSSNNSYTD